MTAPTKGVVMRSRVWLCVGPLLFCLLDGAVTLHGQPAAYWAGQYDQAVEWNPLVRWFMVRHPLLLLAGACGWVLLFSSLILLLPDNTARVVAFLVQLDHTIGAASWLTRFGALGWAGCVALFLVSRAVMEVTWRAAARAALRAGAPGEAG
jgi:hypothetical protein